MVVDADAVLVNTALVVTAVTAAEDVAGAARALRSTIATHRKP